MPQRPKPTRSAIGAAFPQEVAASVQVQALGSDLVDASRRVSKGKFGRERIHALRIACRRYEAASELFAPCFAQRRRERVDGLVNDIRKAAGHVREWDVVRSALNASSIEIEQGAEELESSIRSVRLERAERLRKQLRRGGIEQLRGSIDLLIDEVAPPDGGQRLFSDAAVEAVRQRTRSILMTLRGTLHEVEELHTLRVELRQLRYLLDIAAPCLPADLLERATSGLAAEQECFGALADATSVLDLLSRSSERLGAVPRNALERCGDWMSGVQASSHAAILERVRAGHLARLVMEIDAWASESAVDPTPNLADASLNATAMAPTREDRLAVIDVGSNSVRLLVAEVLSDGTYKVIDDERECTRLGQGLVATGALSAQAMLRTAETIARMRGISQGYGVSRLRVIGTSAVRDATNQREFLSLVREDAGVALDVLDGEDEARAAHRSVAAGFDITQTPTAVVDIGGGSTEVVLSARGAVEHLCSIRIGAVRLSEMCSSEANEQAVKQMRRYVRQCLARALPELPFAPSLVVGTGGTFTALAALATEMGSPSRESSGSELRRSEARHLLDRLGSMSLRDRMRLPRLSPERADIIVAGAAIAEGVLKHLGVNTLRVYDRGVRDGVLLAMIAERDRSRVSPAGSRPMAAVRRFAEACRYETQHSEHVAMLSLRLFDQLRRVKLLPAEIGSAECRMLLEAAAVLHDIGYLVNYAKHHKHSMRLIANSEIDGFTPRQIAIVSNIARYHRRALPTKRHSAFKKLSPADRRVVAGLSAILRVADGLDRAHSQIVKDIVIDEKSLASQTREIVIGASASGRPTTELWGAERKAGLLESEFGIRLSFQWAPRGANEVASLRKGPSVAGREETPVHADAGLSSSDDFLVSQEQPFQHAR